MMRLLIAQMSLLLIFLTMFFSSYGIDYDRSKSQTRIFGLTEYQNQINVSLQAEKQKINSAP